MLLQVLPILTLQWRHAEVPLARTVTQSSCRDQCHHYDSQSSFPPHVGSDALIILETTAQLANLNWLADSAVLRSLIDCNGYNVPITACAVTRNHLQLRIGERSHHSKVQMHLWCHAILEG